MTQTTAAVSSVPTFFDRLKQEGAHGYHDHHSFHLLMHAGQLSKGQLQEWVRNRYYYQSRLPIKDALIIAKAEDRAFRRQWIHRIHTQDGHGDDDGGLVLWLRLAEGVGLDPNEVAGCQGVLPPIRALCDHYVELVRTFTLLESVALSLTELFAPDLMKVRLAAWRSHYPWVSTSTLGYFDARIRQAREDAEVALAFVLQQATTPELQTRCINALKEKNTILWSILDHLYAAYVDSAHALPHHA